MDAIKVFSNINIKYYANFDKLVIKCADITTQLEDLKKIIKILIYKIQSKEIKKDTIIIEFTDTDFLSDDIIKLLNIMKFTKTSHYFNLVVKSTDKLSNRIEEIKNKYAGVKINEGI